MIALPFLDLGHYKIITTTLGGYLFSFPNVKTRHKLGL